MSQTNQLLQGFAELTSSMQALTEQLKITADSVTSLRYAQQKAIHTEPPAQTAANDAVVAEDAAGASADDLAAIKADVTKALLGLVRADRGRAQELLTSFGAASAKDLSPDAYPEVLARAEQALAELKDLVAA